MLQQPPDTSRDEELARSLQKQLDCEQPQQPLRMAVAQPVAPAELPYKCGACGTTHAVRNVSHGATFACANCGAPNQILLADAQRAVVVYVVLSLAPAGSRAQTDHVCWAL